MHVSPNIIFRALNEGGVLVNLDGHDIFELNATAAHMWPLVASGAARDEIIASVVTHFDTDAATASSALSQLVADLTTHGLIQS